MKLIKILDVASISNVYSIYCADLDSSGLTEKHFDILFYSYIF